MNDPRVRAEQARQIVESPAFTDALRSMQESIDRQRNSTAWNETKKREHLYLKERALVELQIALHNAILAGEVVEPEPTFRERVAKTVALKWARN